MKLHKYECARTGKVYFAKDKIDLSKQLNISINTARRYFNPVRVCNCYD